MTPLNSPHIIPPPQMTRFDVQQRSVLAELSTPYVKYVVWNNDMSMVALLCKHAIIIADKKLQGAQTVHETIRVKVGTAWRLITPKGGYIIDHALLSPPDPP